MALTALAQDVEFKASAPAQVIVGKPFQLTYSVNQRAKDLRAPEFPDFDYIAYLEDYKREMEEDRFRGLW